jgi:hypothetical protein
MTIRSEIVWYECRECLPRQDGEYLVDMMGRVVVAFWSLSKLQFTDEAGAFWENPKYWAKMPLSPLAGVAVLGY